MLQNGLKLHIILTYITQMKVRLILQVSIEAVLLIVTDNIRDWDINFYVIKSKDTYI